MSLQFVRNDITKVEADAIVVSVNIEPVVGAGVDRDVFEVAGYNQLLEERKKLGQIQVGKAVATPAFNLPAKIVIHTVCPLWENGENNELDILYESYMSVFDMACRYNCESIALPLLGTGISGIPCDIALQVAIDAIKHILDKVDMVVYLVIKTDNSLVLPDYIARGNETCGEWKKRNGFSYNLLFHNDINNDFKARRKIPSPTVIARVPIPPNHKIPEPPSRKPHNKLPEPPSYRPYGKLPEPPSYKPYRKLPEIPSYKPDEKSPELLSQMPPYISREKPPSPPPLPPHILLKKTTENSPQFSIHSSVSVRQEASVYEESNCNSLFSIKNKNIEDVLAEKCPTFQQTLLMHIARSGMSDVEVYRKANIDRKLFSKIRCNENYKTSKKTILALAIALELDIYDTIDLLAKAELAFSPCNTFDKVVRFYIENKMYDIYSINLMLFKLEQPMLGE